jgi:hypothetical protein
MSIIMAFVLMPPQSQTLQMQYNDWTCTSDIPAPVDYFCSSTSKMPFCAVPSCSSPIFLFESSIGGTLTISPEIFNIVPSLFGFSSVERVTFSNFTVVNSPQQVTMTVGNKVVNITSLNNVNLSSFSLDISVFSDPSVAININHPLYNYKTITRITFTDVTVYLSKAAIVLIMIAEGWIIVLSAVLGLGLFILLGGAFVYLMLWITAGSATVIMKCFCA